MFPVSKFKRLLRKGLKSYRRWTYRVMSASETALANHVSPIEPGTSFVDMQNLYLGDLERYKKYLASCRTELSQVAQTHLRYFSVQARGFTNPGNYVFWKQVMHDFKPVRMLEIGVYRGQTMSLWKILASELGYESEVCGLSPLSSAGDEIGHYLEIDYEWDIRENFAQFGYLPPELICMKSDDLRAREILKSRSFDLVFIDGSHDYDVVKSDIDLSLNSLVPFGYLVLDDSMKYKWNSRKTYLVNTGHPGPSRVADEIALDTRFAELGSCGHNRVFQKSS